MRAHTSLKFFVYFEYFVVPISGFGIKWCMVANNPGQARAVSTMGFVPESRWDSVLRVTSRIGSWGYRWRFLGP